MAVAVSEINHAQIQEQSMGTNNTMSEPGSTVAISRAKYMTDITCYATEEFPLNQCVNRPMAVSLAARNITAISASMGGKYKVFPIMPDNGKDR